MVSQAHREGGEDHEQSDADKHDADADADAESDDDVESVADGEGSALEANHPGERYTKTQ